MTEKPRTLGARVDALERAHNNLVERQDRVEELTERVRKDQSRMRAEIRKLERNVPAKVQASLDVQTSELKAAMAQSETRNADRITSLARQWPIGAVVLATILATVTAALIVDGLLALAHAPHLG